MREGRGDFTQTQGHPIARGREKEERGKTECDGGRSKVPKVCACGKISNIYSNLLFKKSADLAVVQ